MKNAPRHQSASNWALGLAVALPAALPTPLLAQEQNTASDAGGLPAVRIQASRNAPSALNEPTNTGSRMDLTPLQTPASIEVLRGERIRERGDVTVLDAVSRATGIIGSPSPGNGGTSLVARGFSGHGSVMQLFDGSRLYVAAGTVTFPFDTWSVERIEVLRGAASVMFGEGAIGAAVNIVPKKPTREPIEHEAGIALGGDNTRRAAFGSGGAVDEHWSYRFDISHHHTDGFMARGEADSLAVGGAVRLDVSPQWRVTLSHDEGRQEPQRYYGVPLIDGRLDDRLKHQNFNVDDAVLKYRDRWSRLDTEWTPNDRVKLRNQLYHMDSRRHWRNAESYVFSSTTGLVTRGSYLDIGHDQDQVGNRFDATLKAPLLGLNNQVTAGFDVNRIHFQHTNDSGNTASSTVNPFDFAPGNYASTRSFTPHYNTLSDTHALFAEDKLDLTTQWSLVGGLRRDQIEVTRTDTRLAAANFSKQFGYTTGRVGVVFAPTARQSLYAQFARATDPLTGIVSTNTTQANFSFAQGKQVEVGYKQWLDAVKGAWSVAAYRIEKTNILTRTSPGVDQQVGAQSSQGIEASLEIELAKGLSLEANAAKLRARYDDFKEDVAGVSTPVSRAGKTPTNVPQETANVLLDWRFMPRWTARAGLRYVGKRQANTANTARIPSYTVTDASLDWAVDSKLKLGLQAYNLFDRDYAESASNSGGQWLLGRPRSVEVTAHLRF